MSMKCQLFKVNCLPDGKVSAAIDKKTSSCMESVASSERAPIFSVPVSSECLGRIVYQI